MDLLLNAKEIYKEIKFVGDNNPGLPLEISVAALCVSISKSQAQQIFNWGEDYCEHDNDTSVKKWACPICRQEFKAEVNDDNRISQ